MLISKKVMVRWNGKNRKWFESKGYTYKHNEMFEVDVTELSEGSKVMIEFQCDYCGKIKSKQYGDYIKSLNKSVVKKDCCSDCIFDKSSESMIELYGTKNPQTLDFIKERTRQTCLKKYGVENPLQNDMIKEKLKQTCLEKYGCEHHLMSKEVKEKRKQTFLKRYNVENISQSEEIKEKKKETFLAKWNVENPFQSEIIKEQIKKKVFAEHGVYYNAQVKETKVKMKQSLYENGTQKSSKQQRYLCKLFNGELNYAYDNCSLDILLNDNIYIEYQGSGHELNVKFGRYTEDEFKQIEKQRFYFLYRRGFKQIEIISKKDYLPSDEVLINMIEEAKSYLINHSWIIFDIDNSLVKCSQFEKEFNYGTLRKIKKSDLSIIA